MEEKGDAREGYVPTLMAEHRSCGACPMETRAEQPPDSPA